MQIKSCIHVYPILLFVMFVSGCDQPEKPNDEELIEFFEKDKADLASLLKTCMDVPEARWIGLEKYDLYFSKISVNLDARDEHKIARARSAMKRIGVKSFFCNRNMTHQDATLIATKIPKYNRGLSIGGRSKGYIYLTEDAKQTQQRILAGEIKLIEGKWYLYSRED